MTFGHFFENLSQDACVRIETSLGEYVTISEEWPKNNVFMPQLT